MCNGANGIAPFVTNLGSLDFEKMNWRMGHCPRVQPSLLPPRPGGRSFRILVIDDNIHAAESLALIVKLWGHETRVAHSGPDAIEAAAVFLPEVGLLDIGLPGMDGYALAQHLRAMPGLDEMALVAITGYDRDEDRRRSREAGFDHHLVKPLDLDRLESILLNLG